MRSDVVLSILPLCFHFYCNLLKSSAENIIFSYGSYISFTTPSRYRCAKNTEFYSLAVHILDTYIVGSLKSFKKCDMLLYYRNSICT